MEKRLEVAARVQKVLADYFSEPVVRVFGSSITQLGTRSSDMVRRERETERERERE